MQATNLKVFCIKDYEWVSKGVYEHLYLIHDKAIVAKDKDDFIKKINQGENKLLVTPVCPKCFGAMVEWELASTNSPLLLYIALETGNPEPVGSILHNFDVTLTTTKGYGSHGFGPLAAVINGNNANNVLDWLIQSEYWSDELAQIIMEYAANQDWNNDKQKFVNDIIKKCINNGADWQADMSMDKLARIMAVYENDPENEMIFNEMIFWQFSRSVHTGKY
jgi:hypothetical protein